MSAKQKEDTDFLSRNPINGPVEDDEEDGDIPLCNIEVNQPPKDSEDSELIAKIQMCG